MSAAQDVSERDYWERIMLSAHQYADADSRIVYSVRASGDHVVAYDPAYIVPLGAVRTRVRGFAHEAVA